MDNRKLINHKDFIFIGIAAMLAVCIYIFAVGRPSEHLQAEIRQHGRITKMITLEEDAIFPLDEHPAIRFIVHDGRVAFYSSDCPDQICVRRGFLHLPGQSAVCLPNRVVLTIVDFANGESDIDVFLD